MSVILHIETSTDRCSVAVSQDSAIIFQTDSAEKGAEVSETKGTNHASLLGTMVDEALSFMLGDTPLREVITQVEVICRTI